MGMFDKETQLKNAPEFDVAQGCRIFKGEYLGKHKSAEYNETTKAKVWAGPVDSLESDAKEYILFGTMADQIGRIDNGDLPANVKMIQEGRSNVLVLL